MKINFINKTKNDVKDLKKLILNIFKEVENNYIMTIIFVDDEEIRYINKNYRNIDKITDVISFALIDNYDESILIEKEIGDIFIDVRQAERQSIDYGHSFEREVGFLSVHGYLHLLGYDHQTEEDELIMFAKQKEILERANLRR